MTTIVRQGRGARAAGLAAALLAACLLAAAAPAARAAAAKRELPALQRPSVMAPTALSAAVLAVARAGDRLVAVGERGIVLLSDDGGASWRQAPTPVRASLTAVQFVDAQVGWAVGHLGVVLHTDDGGQTWRKQLDGVAIAERVAELAAALPEGADGDKARAYAKMLRADGPDKPLLALHFDDARRGLVTGAYNLALETEDGGRSWTPVSPRLPNPRQLHLYGIHVVDGGATTLIAGEQGLLLRSDDGRRSFTAVPTPYKGTWFGVLSDAEGGWLLYGLRGTVYRSTDRGASWAAVPSGASSSVTAGRRLHDGRVVLATQTGELLLPTGQGGYAPAGAAVPAAIADLAEAADGSLALATLRGPMRAPRLDGAPR